MGVLAQNGGHCRLLPELDCQEEELGLEGGVLDQKVETDAAACLVDGGDAKPVCVREAQAEDVVRQCESGCRARLFLRWWSIQGCLMCTCMNIMIEEGANSYLELGTAPLQRRASGTGIPDLLCNATCAEPYECVTPRYNNAIAAIERKPTRPWPGFRVPVGSTTDRAGHELPNHSLIYNA